MDSIDFNPFPWIRIIACCAVTLQSIELLMLRSALQDSGVWRWEILRREYAALAVPLRFITNVTLPYRNFVTLLVLRSFVAATSVFYADGYLLLFLLVSSLLISIRFRGAFNGGSDYMTNIVLLGCCAAELFDGHPLVALGALYYIALQSCLSYFISGAVKLRSSNWRRGAALRAFVASGIYPPSAGVLALLCKPAIALPLSWSIILFETLFPLAFLSTSICIPVLVIGAGFHLANVYVFGLNRFFLIWLATYPAVLWCAGKVI